VRTLALGQLVEKSLRTSDWVCSSQARRDRTTLLRFLSSSMIFASSVLPTYGCRSRTRRISTSDAGRKPRSPMSRMSPPLTTSITVPSTTSSASFLASIVPPLVLGVSHRISRPSSSLLLRPGPDLVADLDDIVRVDVVLIDSSREGMTPSVLYPMSRRTSSRSTLTMVPSTMSPSLKYLIV
jgi:hypothetical protein